MNADWFYSKGDQRMGPVTEDDLKRLVGDGQLHANDLVWRDGMADWVEARSVQVLFPARVEAARDDERRARRQFENLDDDRPSARPGRREFEDDGDDRPRRRQRYRDEEDDDLDRLRTRKRYRDDVEDDYEDRPRWRSRQKPGQIQAVGIMLLVGGILALLLVLSWAAGTICFIFLWPPIYLELVVGILAIIRGTNMINRDDQGPPKTIAVLLILCILNLDIINCVLGIVSLVMLNDEQVQAYYRKKGF